MHFQKGYVPKKSYIVTPGKARITIQGSDITLVGISYMQLECQRAAAYLATKGIKAEVIDPIWLSPLDIESIVSSVRKTGRLIVVDNDWVTCGASSEIVSQVVERLQNEKQIKVHRMGFAPVTCPPTPTLEKLFYPDGRYIAQAAYDLVKDGKNKWLPDENLDLKEIEFKGPF